MGCMIKNVPAALVIGFYDKKDVRILSIDEDILMLESDEPIEDNFTLKLAVFDLKSYRYEEFRLENCKIMSSDEKEFSYFYEIRLGNPRHSLDMGYKKLLAEVALAIGYKEKGDTCALEFLKDYQPIYPAERENDFFANYQEQCQSWYSFTLNKNENSRFEEAVKGVELAFELNQASLYNQFSKLPFNQAIKTNLQELNLENHGIFSKAFSRVYIGSEFCINAMPSEALLLDLMDKAHNEGYKVTIALPFVKEDFLDKVLCMLQKLNDWSSKTDVIIEAILNDWGIVEYAAHHCSNLQPVLGRLLNKRRKDPRNAWKWKNEQYQNLIKDNSLGSSLFTSFLKGYRIERYEMEACGYDMSVPEGHHSLHFPFYQTNTSEYCTMYADSTNYNRFHQKLVKECPQYCIEFCGLYPKHLNMIARGNSILGFDNRIFTLPHVLERYISSGIDRLVYSI